MAWWQTLLFSCDMHSRKYYISSSLSSLKQLNLRRGDFWPSLVGGPTSEDWVEIKTIVLDVMHGT